MAEIIKELGRIPVSRGNYQATTEYYKDNIVQYKRGSYQVVSESPIVGVPPTNDKNIVNPGWTLFAGTLDAQDVVNQIKEQETKSIQAVADKEAEILAKSDAAEVSFDNTGTSISKTNVQDALEETDDKLSELEGNYINISKKYPTGGTNGTNVYTATVARLKVPIASRKKGTIISYLSDNGWVVEQFVDSVEDNTHFVYGDWYNFKTSNFIDINYLIGQKEPFADAGTARGKIPADMRYLCKGMIISYLLSNGLNVEFCHTDIFDAGFQAWTPLVNGGKIVYEIEDGSINTSKIEDKGITTEKINDNAVTLDKIADNLVTDINISELYPTGGINRTNVYTYDTARLKVPVRLRKCGTTITYLTSKGWVKEQFVGESYDNTQWIYDTNWIDYNSVGFININLYNKKNDAYADAGTARSTIPLSLRRNCKGLIIEYLLSDGWYVEICSNDTFTASAASWIPVIKKGKVVISDNDITLSMIDNAIKSEYPKIGESKFVYSDGIAKKVEYYGDCNWRNAKPYNIAQREIIQGFYSTVDGEYMSHNARMCTQDFISVRASELFKAKVNDNCALYVHLFNVGSDGEATWIGSKNTNQSYHDLQFIIPSNCNAIKLSFYPVNKKTTIERNDVNAGNFTMEFVTDNEYIRRVNPNYTNIAKHCKVNDVNGFAQGEFDHDNIISSNAISTTNPIKVISGHRYAIDFNGFGVVEDALLRGGETPDNISQEIVFAYKEQGLINKNNNRTGVDKNVWIIPKGVNYIRFTVYNYNKSLTVEDGVALDARIVDVTGNEDIMRIGGKYMPLHTQGQVPSGGKTMYSQGLAIDSGYIFQGYSTGVIEVLDYNTKEYISTFEINSQYHLGALYFGEKYDESDEFRMLWIGDINPNYTNNRLEAYKITKVGNTFSAEKIITITPPIDSMATCINYAMNIKEKVLIAINIYGTADNPIQGKLVFTKYMVSEWTDSAVFTEVSTIEYPACGIYPYQSGIIIDGKLYCVLGSHRTNSRIYCFDFNKKELISAVDLRKFYFDFDWREEPQAICVYDGWLYLSGSYFIYRL